MIVNGMGNTSVRMIATMLLLIGLPSYGMWGSRRHLELAQPTKNHIKNPIKLYGNSASCDFTMQFF